MQSVWESLAYLQNFFQLNFLFSGLEVSSNTVLVARLSIFLISLVGVVYVGLRIIIRILDCIHAFLSGLGSLPKSFFLLLIL
ncbi:MAG: type transport system permease protein, partial [Thermodesulfobacteriota bacterium]|nr:type transport system permease protein [Thermodesulfobacteriota bacterium]